MHNLQIYSMVMWVGIYLHHSSDSGSLQHCDRIVLIVGKEGCIIFDSEKERVRERKRERERQRKREMYLPKSKADVYATAMYSIPDFSCYWNRVLLSSCIIL